MHCNLEKRFFCFKIKKKRIIVLSLAGYLGKQVVDLKIPFFLTNCFLQIFLTCYTVHAYNKLCYRFQVLAPFC